jgi:hypothetical protein
MKEKAKFLLDHLVVSIKDKAHHQKNIQEVLKQYQQDYSQDHGVVATADSGEKQLATNEDEEMASVTLSNDEELSEVLSTIHKKMVKKTEK